jgi:hypothetical protein
MHCILWTDWLTLRGGQNGSITQNEDGWLDMSPYQDLVTWLDVKATTPGGGTIAFDVQTSPVRDELYFLSMIGSSGITYTIPGPNINKLLKDTANTPLSRWLRWKITASGVSTFPWDITFRILIAANFKTGAGAPGPRGGPGGISPASAQRVAGSAGQPVMRTGAGGASFSALAQQMNTLGTTPPSSPR